MKIAELFAVITLKGGKETISTMKGILDSTIATKVALLGAVSALYKMSDVARQAAMDLDIYQANTGLSGEQLQELSYNAAQAGVSVKELGGTIQRLQQMSMDVMMGKGMPEPFMWLQIDPSQSPVKQLDRIGAKLRELSKSNPALAKNLANQVGLSDNMYYSMLENTNEQMNKQFLLTEKEQKALVKLNREWNKVWFYIKQITIKLQGIGAALQTRFVKILLNAIQGLGEILTRVYDFISANETLQKVLLALGAVLAAVFAPWLLVLGAVALILEDIFVYFQGGDSITGQIVDWVKSSEDLKNIWLGIKTVIDLVVFAFDSFIKMNKPLIEGAKELWSVIEPMIEKVSDFLKNPAIKALSSMLNPGGEILKGIGKARAWYDEYVGKDVMPANAQGSSSNNVQQNNNVTFQTSGDLHKDMQVASDFVENVSDAMYQTPVLEGAE